jgi:hypothetical protein
MFLPDVEQNPQPGPYRDLIETMPLQNAEYPHEYCRSALSAITRGLWLSA